MAKKKTIKSKKLGTQNIIIGALVVALAIMSVGFAAYSATLNIGGTDNLTVKAAKWDIHWDEESYEEATNSVAASAHNVSGTNVTFTTTLTKPGDFYEFTVDAVNDGTFDADLKSVTLSDISAHSNYLTYSVTYDGQTFTGTSTTLNPVKTLSAGSSKTATVRVAYILPSDSSLLPQSDVTVTLTAAFNYEQAE